jgi:hypothetical protein
MYKHAKIYVNISLSIWKALGTQKTFLKRHKMYWLLKKYQTIKIKNFNQHNSPGVLWL